MRTRSSRFFVILLHLVGVCHHNSPSIKSPSSGLVGVNPWPVHLETVSLSSYETNQQHDGDHLCPSIKDRKEDDNFNNFELLWLQDQHDQLCLGPTGTFAECGDTTLWLVRRHELVSRRSGRGLLLSSLFGATSFDIEKIRREPTVGYTFQVADHDIADDLIIADSTDQKGARSKRNKADCLCHKSDEVTIARCNALWRSTPSLSNVWLINDEGILQRSRRHLGMLTEFGKRSYEDDRNCLQRVNKTNAVLVSCAEDDNYRIQSNATELVRFEFVRYKATTVPTGCATLEGKASVPHPFVAHKKRVKKRPKSPVPKSHIAATKTERILPKEGSAVDSITTLRDKAHSHASEPVMHPELKLSTQLLFTGRKGKKNTTETQRISPFSLLKDANPILLMSGQSNGGSKGSEPNHHVHLSSMIHPSEKKSDDKPIKLQQIRIHPYIEKAKNEVWTDPKTGLDFATDLRQYLGLDKKEHGRHTLMGVGQYIKGYVVKVYGVAFYVSKKDVLADPTFAKYATLSADELRARPDFYKHLQRMNLQSDGKSGRFDRTLLLKTNMQLSTETMRSSLGADWSMLTEEAKETLADSSLKPRPADEHMLRLIESPENPSRCSCSQVAPVEYEADPNCCARGTEIAFTWRKNGDFEVRLNGRLMDTFARPDMAEGIFYEYLRYDNPISPDLRDRVVDGFPFLLGPFAQIRGIHIGHHPSTKDNAENPFFRGLASFASSTSTMAFDWFDATHHDFNQMVGETKAHIDTMKKEMHKLSDVFHHHREQMVKQIVSMPQSFMSSLLRNKDHIEDVPSWAEQNVTPSEAVDSKREPMGRYFGYPLSRWLGDSYYHASDEIGPMRVHPTMNRTRKVFLTLVHLYLLLLFIVSFPGSYSTKTKILIRKSLHRDYSLQSMDSSQNLEHLSETDDSDDCGISFDASQVQQATEHFTYRNCAPPNFASPSSKTTLLRRAQQVLRPTKSEDKPSDQNVDGSSCGTSKSLKQKSLSYFL